MYVHMNTPMNTHSVLQYKIYLLLSLMFSDNSGYLYVRILSTYVRTCIHMYVRTYVHTYVLVHSHCAHNACFYVFIRMTLRF